MPIGLLSVIKGVTGGVMRRFYAKRYNPKAMAVICVGDFFDSQHAKNHANDKRSQGRKEGGEKGVGVGAGDGDGDGDGGGKGDGSKEKVSLEEVLSMLKANFGTAVNSHWADAEEEEEEEEEEGVVEEAEEEVDKNERKEVDKREDEDEEIGGGGGRGGRGGRIGGGGRVSTRVVGDYGEVDSLPSEPNRGINKVFGKPAR